MSPLRTMPREASVGLDRVLASITVGACLPVLDREPDSVIDVRDHDHEQETANQPEKRPKIAQVLGIAVDPFGAEKNLQVAEQMPDDEEDEDDSSHRHDHFPSDR